MRILRALSGPALLIPLLGLFALGGCSSSKEELKTEPVELVRFKPTLTIRRAWNRTIGDGADNLRLALGAATDGATVYAAAHDGRIVAFSAEKGRRRWKRNTKVPLSGGPAVGYGLVAAGSSDGDVVALDAETGKVRWRTSVSSEVLASPAITASLVFVRTVDGKLVALDFDDGEPVWFVQQTMPRLTVRGTGAPIVVGDLVINGFDNGRLVAYGVSDGSQAWEVLLSPPSGRTEVDRLSDLNATIRVVGEDIYVVGYQSVLAALAAESGQVLWTRDISSHSGIGVDFASLFVSRDDSHLLALTRRDGRELWRQDKLAYRDISAPTPFGSSVVVGDFEGYVHWFDARTGELQARVSTGGRRITSAPIVVNEYLYVLTDGGELFAFRDRTRKEKS